LRAHRYAFAEGARLAHVGDRERGIAGQGRIEQVANQPPRKGQSILRACVGGFEVAFLQQRRRRLERGADRAMSESDPSLSRATLVDRVVPAQDGVLGRRRSVMSTALLVIDAQQSFLHRPYWREDDVPAFVTNLQRLIDRCVAARDPVVQVFHEDPTAGADDPFSPQSGLVVTLPQLRIDPRAVFRKSVHSAMFARTSDGRTLERWMRDEAIDHVIVTGIRTEQCCETTARHASDLGFRVTYALDATLTFPMLAKSGRTYSAAELKERTELVLAGRFAQVMSAEAVGV
jgi:nicotinamidase-related amidase